MSELRVEVCAVDEVKGREGIVIKAAVEGGAPVGGLQGRRILKSVSADYLSRNDIADDAQE